jgi:hypothetical protein
LDKNFKEKIMKRYTAIFTIAVVIGLSATGTSYGLNATVHGQIILEGETDHSGCIACLDNRICGRFCDETDSNGYFHIDIECFVFPKLFWYDVDPPCLGWSSLDSLGPFIVRRGDNYWDPDTLERGIEGYLNGEFCRGGEYPVNGNIRIADGDQVKIYAKDHGRIQLTFNGDYYFKIRGTLKAEGDEEDSVVFTGTGDWQGIRFDQSDYYSTLKYCQITKGNADGGGSYNNGGAIYVYSSDNVYIEHSKIYQNYATDRGGGICFYSQSDTAHVLDCDFSRNTAENYGGGIFCYNSNPDIGSCIVNNCYSERGGGLCCDSNSNPAIDGCSINNNDATYGGGIYCTNSDPDIDGCVISLNHAIHGGGIECAASDPDIDSCRISNNYAEEGGGIYCADSDPSITESIINDNDGSDGGGVYCVNNSVPFITSSPIEENEASGNGGGIYFENCNGDTISNYILRDNQAIRGGGAYIRDCSNLTFTNCNIYSNTANSGGGAYLVSSDDTHLENCEIRNNEAPYYGSGINLTSCVVPVLAGCNIETNIGALMGGGIYCYNSNPAIVNRTVISNNYATEGGGIYISSCGGSELERCLINNNEAENRGGGIFFDNFSSLDTIMYHATILDNSADSGCGIYCSFSDVICLNSIVYDTSRESSIVLDDNSSFTATYSDIAGGWFGAGNIDCAPEYVDPDIWGYRLHPSSCVIDSGYPEYPGPPLDPDGTRLDMGAYYFDWPPGISIWMVPDDPPVEVPAGGSFTYTGVLKNNSNQPRIIDVWAKVRLPGSGWYQQPVKLFNNIRLGVQQRIAVRGITQPVPGIAPSGLYLYAAFCGYYPVGIIDSCSFQFTVIESKGNCGEDWTLSNRLEGAPIDDEFGALPAEFELNQNYPNPFNPSTTFRYSLPVDTHVSLEIYNLLGQRIETLIDDDQSAGYKSITWDASEYASGIYFYRLTAGNKVFTKRMTLTK